MPRIKPRIPYTCYVCGTSFTISNAGINPFKPETRAVMRTPVACPCCTAPEKVRGQLTVGAARGLVLAHYGNTLMQEQYGGAAGYLEALALTPEDVATLIGIVNSLDYADWANSLSTDAAADPEAREELKIAQQAGREAQSGTLLPRLRSLAAQVTAKLEQQRTIYLARYNEHCGAGQQVPAVVYRVPQTGQQKN
ncbi:MAG TPA: hypothetical protein VFS21_14055 [Roseiflexaceae bacterium]|nr:hypothetical protein [Roseiflexaceae bacterium]